MAPSSASGQRRSQPCRTTSDAACSSHVQHRRRTFSPASSRPRRCPPRAADRAPAPVVPSTELPASPPPVVVPLSSPPAPLHICDCSSRHRMREETKVTIMVKFTKRQSLPQPLRVLPDDRVHEVTKKLVFYKQTWASAPAMAALI